MNERGLLSIAPLNEYVLGVHREKTILCAPHFLFFIFYIEGGIGDHGREQKKS
jgi:hypothetical protein